MKWENITTVPGVCETSRSQGYLNWKWMLSVENVEYASDCFKEYAYGMNTLNHYKHCTSCTLKVTVYVKVCKQSNTQTARPKT